jgi:hypothetical protein
MDVFGSKTMAKTYFELNGIEMLVLIFLTFTL